MKFNYPRDFAINTRFSRSENIKNNFFFQEMKLLASLGLAFVSAGTFPVRFKIIRKICSNSFFLRYSYNNTCFFLIFNPQKVRVPCSSQDSCQKICAASHKCKFWTFWAGKCWLKAQEGESNIL